VIEKVGNLWIESAQYRCIPTSGAVEDGEAVIESGVALEATRKFDGLRVDLGRLITSRGNHVHLLRPGLLSFPVSQYKWSGPAIPIIERSAHQLAELVGDAKTLLPRPGCGPGELAWEEVAKVLAFLPDNVIVLQHS
jgi:hypothetical protein